MAGPTDSDLHDLFYGSSAASMRVQALFSGHDLETLQRYWDRLPTAQKQQIFQQLSTTPKAVQPLIQQLQNPLSQTPSTAAVAQSQGQPAAQPAAAVAPPADISPGGVPYGSAYGAGEIGLANLSEPAALAAAAGTDVAALQAEYQSYLRSYQEVGVRHGFQDYQAGTPPMSLVDFANTKANALQGLWRPLLDAEDHQWRLTNGAPMPAELRRAVLQQLQGLDPNSQKVLLQQVAAYVAQQHTAQAGGKPFDVGANAQAMLQALPPFIQTTIGNYAASHVQGGTLGALQTSQAQQFIQQYYAQTGKTPPQDLINKYVGMPANEQTAFLDNLPMQGVPMTYGEFTSTNNALMGAGWVNVFGKDPTPDQVYQFAGKNKLDIQAYLDNQDSRQVPGMKVGVYNNLQQVGSDISTKLFGTPDSAQLIQLFHDSGKTS